MRPGAARPRCDPSSYTSRSLDADGELHSTARTTPPRSPRASARPSTSSRTTCASLATSSSLFGTAAVKRVHGLVPVQPADARRSSSTSASSSTFSRSARTMRPCFFSFTRWISSRAEIGHRCRNAAHASCRRRVEPCPSRCMVRASTSRRCTRYAIRRRSVSRAFLALSPSYVRVSRLTSADMVENRVHHHP